MKYTTDIKPLLDAELAEGFAQMPVSTGTFDPEARRALGRQFAAELHVFPGAYHASSCLQPQTAISMRARVETAAALGRIP